MWVGTCFGPVRTASSGGEQSPLRAAHAAALAELLQVLACGEESAVLAFEHLGRSGIDRALRKALAGIAADEARHQVLLANLRRTLPEPAPDPALQASIRRFFLRLADRDARVHCARIAAVDSAVCQILGALRKRGRPLTTDSAANSVLGWIHRDEARHVAIARRCCAGLLGTSHGRDILIEARERLADLLELRAASLDELEVEPDRLLARLRVGRLSVGSFG